MRYIFGERSVPQPEYSLKMCGIQVTSHGIPEVRFLWMCILPKNSSQTWEYFIITGSSVIKSMLALFLFFSPIEGTDNYAGRYCVS